MQSGFLRPAICASLLAIGVGQAAHAAEPGFYVGLSAGQADYDIAASDGVFVAVQGGGMLQVRPDSTQVDDDGVSWSATLGYRIHTYVAAELAYMSFAEADVAENFAYAGFGPFPSSVRFTQRSRTAVTGPAVSLLGILPLGAGWEAYLRGGVLFADQEHESIYAMNMGSDKTTFGSEEWLAGAGIQWTFGGRWGVRLEYQRIDTIDSTSRTGETDLDQLSLTGTFAL